MMLCYRDRTYCASPNCVDACGRKLTPEIQKAAEAWWGSPDAPIAVSYFCGVPESTAAGQGEDQNEDKADGDLDPSLRHRGDDDKSGKPNPDGNGDVVHALSRRQTS